MVLERTIGGKPRRLGLLTVDDLVSITDSIPNPSGEIVDLRGLDKWAKNPRGCEFFLELAAVKCDPTVKRADVATWGTIMERCNVAAELYAASITTGEGDSAPKAPGGHTNPPTGN